MVGQELSYLILTNFPQNENTVSAALFLLALIAKNDDVRRRHVFTADEYGLNVPIHALSKALTRSQSLEHPTSAEEDVTAELQRRGCLFLGALADGDSDIASLVVAEGGLEAVLEATEWFRYHEDVGNWALWAVFILCYDHSGNQDRLIELRGVQIICRVMKDVPQSVGVQRHGIAILFDLMREVPGSTRNPVQIRLVALNANLHQVVRNAMLKFSKSVEIMMMGRQMLVATGYQGNIPKYQGAIQKR